MKSTLTTMVLSLTALTVVLGALLAWVHNLTEEPMAQAEAKARTEALTEILPPFDNDPAADRTVVDGLTVFPARHGGAFSGAAVEAWSDNGFGGRITLLAGFDASGSLTGYRVMSHAETPGLGARMGEWFSSATGSRSVLGTAAELHVRADGGDIDAITGATITSRAFLEAVNSARNAYESYLKSISR